MQNMENSEMQIRKCQKSDITATGEFYDRIVKWLDVVPGNTPAKKLYEKHGFTYVGDADLELGIEGISVFSLYEWNVI